MNGEPVSQSLMLLAALVAGAAVVFLSLAVYQTAVQPVLSNTDVSQGGVLRALAVALVRRIGSLNRRMMWVRYEDRIGRQLIQAGEPRGYKPEDILALQEVGTGLGLVLGAALTFAVGQNPIWALITSATGALLPLVWLRDQVKARHLRIARALPYNLDLLTLAVEAGLDFTGALAKVVERGKAGPLRDELSLALKQLKMGKTREEALKNMMARVDLPSLTQFVTGIVQADKMGTSLGRVLRIQSNQLRVDRTQRAEKLANQAPVKMLFPLIACIFPTVFLVLFGPIVFAFLFGNAAG